MIIDYVSVENELDIDMSSAFSFEKNQIDFPKLEAKYHRWKAMANKELNDLMLDLEVLIGTIVTELSRKYREEHDGKEVPATIQPELRRTRVSLDSRYQVLVREINVKKEQVEILSGICIAFKSKNDRMNNLTYLAQKLMIPDWQWFSRKPTDEEIQKKLL